VYLLSLYTGFATAATDILFGQIFGVSPGQITLLIIVAIAVLTTMMLLYRPLLFASIDPDLAVARGVPTRLVGLLFVYVLALTVTEAAQIVGTLLVLSLAITPAAAATRLTARTPVLIALSIAFSLIAADGGLLLGLIYSAVKASVFISTISFAIYAVVRLAAAGFPRVFTGRPRAKLADQLSWARGQSTTLWRSIRDKVDAQAPAKLSAATEHRLSQREG
jgi:zinc/manganese transport system permease protein